MAVHRSGGSDDQFAASSCARKLTFDVQTGASDHAFDLTARTDGEFVDLNLAIERTFNVYGAFGGNFTPERETLAQDRGFGSVGGNHVHHICSLRLGS